MAGDPFKTLRSFRLPDGRAGRLHSLPALEQAGLGRISRLPVSIRIVLESVLRNCDGVKVQESHVRELAAWRPNAPRTAEIPFIVARVVLQDFTGVPLLADLAAMRSCAERLGRDPEKIEPLVPVDLVIDHSVQIDYFGSPDALRRNMALEFERNRERYAFLKWGMRAFDTFRVVPPGIGIIHQVNLEYLFHGVRRRDDLHFPDTLVGTDSHTTMINAAGVVGWGVGGIEAEAGMLGQPVYFLTPDVVGVELQGKLRDGVTATDLVLTLTELLRREKVVGTFVEFFGAGTAGLTLTDRATIANMSPECGATMNFFPVDEQTIAYLRGTGRSEDEIGAFEAYFKAQGLFGMPGRGDIDYSRTLTLDLATVAPSLAGPKRPQDRVEIGALKQSFTALFSQPAEKDGFGRKSVALARRHKTRDGQDIGHGDVLIAAITSCTNTSNPSVMIAAGLLAKKAVERGLAVRPHVKTSLAPGSRVVTEYLTRAGLLPYLEKLGFGLAAYGCTTCIGNAGPLAPDIEAAIAGHDLVCAAVLSGNRNFEARIHPSLRANYLASPPLVVAFALAGTVDIDLTRQPLGKDKDGKDVFLRDIWPSNKEIADLVASSVSSDMFTKEYADVFKGSESWNAIEIPAGDQYTWNEASTYIKNPPYFDGMTMALPAVTDIQRARVLGLFGDSITTDHISPAGSIKKDSPAGRYLIGRGVDPKNFNSYGSRRGNDDVMVRGTFANIRIKNHMLDGVEGGYTLHVPSGEQLAIYDAAMKYKAEGTPLVVIAGKEYGTGSSRDWAAKGTLLLGVKAVIAESFERIHRSNLVGMGVLPLQFTDGQTAQSLGLTGKESYDISGLDGGNAREATVTATAADGSKKAFKVKVLLLTPKERDFYRHGGILQYVLRQLAGKKAA